MNDKPKSDLCLSTIVQDIGALRDVALRSIFAKLFDLVSYSVSKFTFLLFKVTPNSSFHAKRGRTIGASTRSKDEQAPTMRFKLCSRGRRINLHGERIHIV